MFEVFVESPNVTRWNVPAIEYQATNPDAQGFQPIAALSVGDLQPDLTQVASSVLITDAMRPAAENRTTSQRLMQQTLRNLRPSQASKIVTTSTPAIDAPQQLAQAISTDTASKAATPGTIQAFLEAQRLENRDTSTGESEAIAQNSSPSRFPTTRTQTEVVEEKIDETTTFEVKQIEIVGNTRFPESELAAYTKPLEGRQIGLAELRQAVDAITQLYLSKGYLNSRAFLGNQEVTDGTVTIQILEGSVEAIQVEGNNRLPDSYVLDRLRSGVESPLRGDKLEEQLRLLQIDPALETVEASLSPGSAAGKSLLTVRVKEAKTAYFGVTSDNYSAPVVGSERYGIYGGLRSLLIPGDEFFASYNRTTSGGLNALDFLYRAPVNAQNGTIQLRVAPSWYNITDQEIGQLFDIDGNSQLYELTYRQPIMRNFRQEFALSLGFALQNGNSEVSGTNLFDTNNRARVLKFGQDFISRDTQGVWAGQSSFNLGLDIFNATDNPSPQADGEFFSWTGQIQRVQRFNPSNVLIAQLNMQFSPDPLLPSQQFIIGGGQSVRGFRQNARFGDNGIRFSLEHRTVVARNRQGNSVAQLAPFFDLGTVWNVGDNPIASPNQRFLAGAGLGLILQPLPGLNMRFDYAVPFRRVDEKNDNLQDQAFYFSLGYQP
ncbi:ShlB/FhaC/HecB family hemolysin secretion/activation protein [filamentous cyanobacterium LEGE 11480]|uniref:ShlB/FhaC/HecB family hemolysin secretion/activation protein n=1 Tax=Romeriopsis navalis LEGE 11480 TaxID=2777977 RepID=A0A928VQK7_9CYAN|nr:ShlB/FhaC/HecB family hemolysin secretion/activation protein [Romeriopsis navalis]MBE9030294.1 ShlB/FhaC/HecB family hemolysin secretion/activation protein [Romeriopsis navalis LEGE 11480]